MSLTIPEALERLHSAKLLAEAWSSMDSEGTLMPEKSILGGLDRKVDGEDLLSWSGFFAIDPPEDEIKTYIVRFGPIEDVVVTDMPIVATHDCETLSDAINLVIRRLRPN